MHFEKSIQIPWHLPAFPRVPNPDDIWLSGLFARVYYACLATHGNSGGRSGLYHSIPSDNALPRTNATQIQAVGDLRQREIIDQVRFFIRHLHPSSVLRPSMVTASP